MSRKKTGKDPLDMIADQLKRIEDSMDKTSERLNSIDKTLVKQEENLKEHMRRTQILEDDIKPVKKHVARVEGAFKLVGLVATLVGIAVGIVKLVTMVP